MAPAPPHTDPVDRIRQALTDRGLAVRNDRGHKFTAQCPAHDDRTPSLDVATGDDGKALVICRSAGCATADILAALDLNTRDLFPPTNGTRHDVKAPDPGQPRTLETTYTYTSSGEPLIRKNRYRLADGTKTFTIQHRTTPTGPWRTGQAGLPADPYRWADWHEADPHRAIFVVEGEKDADRLADLGLLATTHINGAPSSDTPKWPNNYGPLFAGRHVIILPDNDTPGQLHAQHAAANIHPHAASVRIIHLPDLPPKGDISDWLDLEHTLADLHDLADTTPTWTPDDPGNVINIDDHRHELSPYQPLTVNELLSLPAPAWLIDGILPASTCGLIIGLPGSGKTYLALDLACHVADSRCHAWGSHATRTGTVVYITGEGQWGLAARLEAWIAGHPEADLGQLRIIRTMPHATDDTFPACVAQIDALPDPPVLIIIDTLARFAFGLEENSATEMGRLIAAVEAMRDRWDTNVTLVHHTRKDGLTYRGSSAIEGAVSTIISVALNAVAEPQYLVLECERQKDGQPFPRTQMTMHKWGESGYLELADRSPWNTRDVRLIKALSDTPEMRKVADRHPYPWTPSHASRPSDVPSRTWTRGIEALVTRGLLEERGKNRHREIRWTEFAAIELPHIQVADRRSIGHPPDPLSDTPPPSLEGGSGGEDSQTADPQDGEIIL